MLPGVKAFLWNPSLKKYLFLLRDDKPGIAEPDTWSLVGGGMEAGETPQQAIVREIWEEIGLEVDDPKLILRIDQHSDGGLVGLFVFRASIEPDHVWLNEGRRAEFFTLDEALERDLSPWLPDVIAQCKHSL